MTILACDRPATSPAAKVVRKTDTLPAPYRRVRKPAIRRPGLKDLIDDRFRIHHRAASVYVIHADAGYHVTVGWIGENLSYRLKDDTTSELATVTDNAHACSCPDYRRNYRKACRHMLAIRSAFEHVGELPPESQPDPGDSWDAWEDDATWTIGDPDSDFEAEEHGPTLDDSYAPTELESLEWLGRSLALAGEVANPTRDVELMPALRSFFRGKLSGEIDRELAACGPRETDGYPAGYCS